jgi:hypothetical protein
VADRHLAKVRQVLRQAPRKPTVPTDHAASRDRGHDGDDHVSTGVDT